MLVQGFLFRAAFLRRIPLFTRNLIENVLLCLVASSIESSARRWLTTLELQWRDVLTERIHKNYFLNMVSQCAVPFTESFFPKCLPVHCLQASSGNVSVIMPF